MPIPPHGYWQSIHAPGAFAVEPPDGFSHSYPAVLPDGRQILLPIRVLPVGDRAVASLIVNQASFAVEDALCDAMAALTKRFEPDIVVGIPTLGLPLANGVARRLGHPRMVPLGTSRKFWYREELSEPVTSITSPGAGKRLYVDPRMLPVLENRRVLVVDDVVSTGASMAAALTVLGKAGVAPVGVVAAMAQGDRWRTVLEGTKVAAAFATPIFEPAGDERWKPLNSSASQAT